MIEFKVGDKVTLKDGNSDAIFEITAIYKEQDVVMLKGLTESWVGATSFNNLIKTDEKNLKRKKVKMTASDEAEEVDTEKPKSKRGKQKSIEDYWP